jgi:hypothetical protein
MYDRRQIARSVAPRRREGAAERSLVAIPFERGATRSNRGDGRGGCNDHGVAGYPWNDSPWNERHRARFASSSFTLVASPSLVAEVLIPTLDGDVSTTPIDLLALNVAIQ